MTQVAARPPVVLGIDPGTLFLGYGALANHRAGPRLFAAGRLVARSNDPIPLRLGALRAELDALLAELRPDVVVIEEAFCGRNPQSALRMGEGRGVALSCAAAFGARIVQLSPASAKKSICGNGRASKAQVAAMVARLLGTPPLELPEDASDALALALAHVHESALAGRLGRAF